MCHENQTFVSLACLGLGPDEFLHHARFLREIVNEEEILFSSVLCTLQTELARIEPKDYYDLPGDWGR
jgi:hypothetical protein